MKIAEITGDTFSNSRTMMLKIKPFYIRVVCPKFGHPVKSSDIYSQVTKNNFSKIGNVVLKMFQLSNGDFFFVASLQQLKTLYKCIILKF